MKKINIQKWNGPDALTCFESLKDQSYAIFFDSNRPSHSLNQWSYICWDPIEIIACKNNVITLDGIEQSKQDIFSFLQSRLDEYQFNYPDNGIPFKGGIAGYFGYDLGRQLEEISTKTKDDLNIPDLMVGIYSNVLAFDHIKNEAWLIGDEPKIEAVNNKVSIQHSLNWKTSVPEDKYKSNIQHIINEIHAGEVYQVNLSRRFEANFPNNFNPLSHYLNLRKTNPAPFSAFMNFGDIQLASCSPERFLKVEGNIVETRPIKGTLPSSKLKENLLNSTKDRAENTMIVDLLRNDLSKVCDFHSVKVDKLCAVETFEGLHHLVSTVRGVLQKDKSALDAFRACFPGGSITGAPKLAAMKLIEKLEPTRRGPYCGAMGYVGFDGNMDTNITIRTLIYANKKIYLQSGGGIVSDSQPELELQESLDKINKIFESFQTTKKDVA